MLTTIVILMIILISSTVFGAMFLFSEKKTYTIAEIVDEYCGEDIMNTPVSVQEDLKQALRRACKNGRIKAIKIKSKWRIYKKNEAIKYLVKYELKL